MVSRRCNLESLATAKINAHDSTVMMSRHALRHFAKTILMREDILADLYVSNGFPSRYRQDRRASREAHLQICAIVICRTPSALRIGVNQPLPARVLPGGQLSGICRAHNFRTSNRERPLPQEGVAVSLESTIHDFFFHAFGLQLAPILREGGGLPRMKSYDVRIANDEGGLRRGDTELHGLGDQGTDGLAGILLHVVHELDAHLLGIIGRVRVHEVEL